ncbi:MAG: Macrolide export protein MacA [Candidatus Marinimicrobia bacterium]|nr:Macrolide export protein MacA [Candidatus Neomarinimicrobiota bacterium]
MLKKIIILLLPMMVIASLLSCSNDSAGEEASVEEVVAVELFTAKHGTVHRSLNLLGNVKGKQEVRIFSKIPDRITSMNVEMGDSVRKGDLLAVVQNNSLKSRVKQVQANLEQAQAQQDNLENEYQRILRLYNENAVSQQQYDGTKTQLEATRAQVRSLQEALNQAKSQLGDTYIRSPLNGIVGQRFLEEGDMAAGQMPVVTVVQMDTVKVAVNIVERYANDVRTGLESVITVKALPDTSFKGTVSKISPVIDPLSRMIAAEIRIPNPNSLLRPGMFAEVTIYLETRENTITIPKYAVLQKTELVQDELGRQQILRENHVYTVDNDRAYYRTIETGIEEEGLVEVTSGLSSGEKVVLIGQSNLEDSSKVRIVEKEGRI